MEQARIYASHFNSRPSRRATLSNILVAFIVSFNSRPHGGRHALTRRLNFSLVFQLTPSRRRQNIVDVSKNIRVISTHALTEGDERDFADAVSASISTHALTEGDYPLPAIRSHQHHFNSRPHGGRRGFRTPFCRPA